MKIKACNAFNAMFVDTVDTGVCFLCSVFNSTISIPDECIDSVNNPDGFNWNLDSDRRLFIQYSKCSTQICIDSVDNPSAEFSHLIEP